MTFTPRKIKPSSHWCQPAILSRSLGFSLQSFQNMAVDLMFNARLKTITNDIM